MASILALVGGGFGVVCTAAAGYLFVTYYRYARYPIREPTDVSVGDVVGMAGRVTDASGSVTAPISGAAVPAVHWRVDRRSGQTQTPWATIGEGVSSADAIVVESAGYEVPVDLPAEASEDDVMVAAFSSGLDRSAIDYHELVDAGEDPPSEVAAFEERTDLPFDVGDRGKRYMEAHVEPGDDVTVYGRVEATSGEVAAPDAIRLASEGGTASITTEQRQETLQKYLYGGLAALLFRLPPLAVAAFVLL